MKKTILAVLASAFMLTSFPVCAAVDAGKAESFVKKITKEGIEEIINSTFRKAKRTNALKNFSTKRLISNSSDSSCSDAIGGRPRKARRTNLSKSYRQLNVKTWSKRFDEFKGKDFIFEGTSPSTSANQVFVNSKVPMDQGKPATVVWRVKQNGSSFKIVDIIIENVSLAITARNEYINSFTERKFFLLFSPFSSP